MPSISPYLNFMGNTEVAFNFYRSVFGGEFLSLQRFKDTPEAGKLPADDQGKIMHIALPIGNGDVLMATDALESMGQKFNLGNNFYISVNTDSKEEADKIYNGLSANGNIELPIQHTFWGSYFGMFSDQFGVQWMVSFTPQQSN
jgi:PhnB protein